MRRKGRAIRSIDYDEFGNITNGIVKAAATAATSVTLSGGTKVDAAWTVYRESDGKGTARPAPILTANDGRLGFTADGGSPGGEDAGNAKTYTFYFTTTVYVPAGMDPNTVQLRGTAAVDNLVRGVTVNGRANAVSVDWYGVGGDLRPFVLSKGFHAGNNTVAFKVVDREGDASGTIGGAMSFKVTWDGQALGRFLYTGQHRKLLILPVVTYANVLAHVTERSCESFQGRTSARSVFRTLLRIPASQSSTGVPLAPFRRES